MPTIIRELGFEIRINTRDHAPPHVHCERGSVRFVVDLETLTIRQKAGPVKPQDIRDAVGIVTANIDIILRKWHEYHG